MPSPFPGMDPYLERHWADVHADLVALARTALNAVLPGDLVARMEERVVIDRVDYSRPRAIYPDVRVYQDFEQPSASAGAMGRAALAEPIVLEFESEQHTETYVTILDADGGELVTVIEFLSPSNKLPGEGRDQYRRKRDELATAKVGLVEVDLVRQGSWRELLRPAVAPARIDTAYRVTSRRWNPKERIELFPISLRYPLPSIPIPLRPDDHDAPLDLQALVQQAYRNGRYERTDYSKACDPPLEGADAEWADELLRAAGRRKTP